MPAASVIKIGVAFNAKVFVPIITVVIVVGFGCVDCRVPCWVGFVVIVDGVPVCDVGLFVGDVANNDAATEKIEDVGVVGLDGDARERSSSFSSSCPPLSISL